MKSCKEGRSYLFGAVASIGMCIALALAMVTDAEVAKYIVGSLLLVSLAVGSIYISRWIERTV